MPPEAPHIQVSQDCPLIFPGALDAKELAMLMARMAATTCWTGIAHISLCITNDGILARLNRQFLHCLGPTNVISFPVPEEGYGGIYISQGALLRECILYGQNYNKQLLRLASHGLAHLQGLDHGSEMEAMEMKFYNAGREFLKKTV